LLKGDTAIWTDARRSIVGQRVRSFFEPPDPYTSKVLKISLLEEVQNLTGAVLQFQPKTVLTLIAKIEQI
jgi:hypothetical protein